jgi:hypothetical protein
MAQLGYVTHIPANIKKKDGNITIPAPADA